MILKFHLNKIQVINKICLLLLISLFFSSSLAALEKEKAVSIYKEKLIVADFLNNSSWPGIEKGLTDDILTLFVKTKRFDIIERERLLAILKEQELQMSGIVNTSDAVKIGQIVGANYMIFGSITSADGYHSEKEAIKKYKDRKGNVSYKKYIITTWVGRVTISARLVEINTGRIIIAKSVSGEAFEEREREKEDTSFFQSILNAAASGDETAAMERYNRQTEEKLVNSAREKAAFNLINDFLKEFPLSGYILDKTEDNNYLIDLGTEKGLNSLVNLKILGASEKIKHPVTGEVINIRTKSLGFLKVIDIGGGTSVAKSVKGDEDLITPGLKVEVVDPVFIWHRALASFIFPGLGQILEKRWGSGILFFLGEGLLITGAYYSYYRSTPASLEKQNLLDDTDWKSGKGTQYDRARTQALVSMWIFIGFEIILHTWDTVDAGYPAEKNNAFAKKTSNKDVRLVYDDIKKQETFYFGKAYRF